MDLEIARAAAIDPADAHWQKLNLVLRKGRVLKEKISQPTDLMIELRSDAG